MAGGKQYLLNCLLLYCLQVVVCYSYHGKDSQSVVRMEQIASPMCDVGPDSKRFDCQPDPASSQQSCDSRGCCWKLSNLAYSNDVNVPYCFFPSNYPGYYASKITETDFGYTALLTRTGNSHWPEDIMELKLDVLIETSTRLHFKIYDSHHARYEVPIKTPKITTKSSDTDYKVAFTKNPFGITVTRASTGAVLFDSAMQGAPLIFANQFIQMSTALSSQVVYGLGEHKAPLQKGGGWAQYSMWNRDQPPSFGDNLYGSHPFFVNLEPKGDAHGVFLLNSNAMDVAISPAPAVTFRTIGGILDFYVFTGPTADSVISQYTDVIGKPFLPPYWSLGFHLCRYGYSNTKDVKDVIARNRAIGIPYEVQWTDIDYMDSKLDWTYDNDKFAGLPDVVNDLHQKDQHYIMIIDPGISNLRPGKYPSYDEGIKEGIFITNSTGQPIVGAVWPGSTVFPDFTNPKSYDWWYKQALSFYKELSYDSIWIDMNEPSNFVYGSTVGCPGTGLDNPPYVPGIAGEKLPDRTLCPSALHKDTSHYNVHNIYGLTETMATHSALVKIRGKRSIVISRSTFPSQGAYGGHWGGDVFSTWEDLHYSIPALLEFGMYGIPFMGSDICGFSLDTTEELCIRWMQLGAFYVFCRNHNDRYVKDQDPAVFSPQAQQIMKHVLELRYALLPYLYTLLVKSHLTGVPAARPLSFSFPADENTHAIDKQFMWGEGLLISPVLTQGATSVEAYFPKAIWYDIMDGRIKGSTGYVVKIEAPLDKIPVHVRGGSIIPIQAPAVTTVQSRKNPFEILIALNEQGEADGEMVWDDGESLGLFTNFDILFDQIEKYFIQHTFAASKYTAIRFHAGQARLNSTIISKGYVPPNGMPLGTLKVFGVGAKPKEVIVNGKSIPFEYQPHLLVLLVEGIRADLLTPLIASWSS